MADLVFPEMLHGAVTLSPHARARVVRVDTSRAARHPGVMAIVTAKDVPGKRFYGLIVPDWPGFVAEGFARTTSTGHGACRVTYSLTDPSRTRDRNPLPWEPTTITS